MLGKILIDNDWHICKFEDKNLYILKTSCESPLLINKDNITLPNHIYISLLDNGQIYYFDSNSSIEIRLNSEIYHSMFENINYFALSSLTKEYSLNNVRKISFVGGIVAPMLQLLENISFNLDYKSSPIKIFFNKQQESVEDLCRLDFGYLMLETNNTIVKYSIDIEFDNNNDFGFIYSVIYKIYDFIRLINCDAQPCIFKIEVVTNNFKVDYFDKIINYNCDAVYNFNMIANVKSKLGKILNSIFGKDYKFDFLECLNRNEILFEDMNMLSQAIDSISPQYDLGLKNSISTEIEKWKKLKDKIKDTINEFEKDNGKIDSNKKSFILGLIEMSKFRQKIMYLLNEYNKFAEQYSKYITLSEKQIIEISKDISDERNNIHGNNNHISPNKLIHEIQYILMGLLVFIFLDYGLSYFEIFNLLDSTFHCRIQQINS